jgi:hypothetical protein
MAWRVVEPKILENMLMDWNRRFPHSKPVAHHLPVTFPDRWVRFHSLPGSKRYPENEAEYAIVLERHNRILGELAQKDETAALLTTGYSETPEPIRSYDQWMKLDPLAVPWCTVAMHETDDNFPEPNFWHVFVSKWVWKPGVFDPLVRLVADDVIANVMIVAADCRWLLHPYDGGMDVILESSAVRDRLKGRYPEWLSPRADGR